MGFLVWNPTTRFQPRPAKGLASLGRVLRELGKRGLDTIEDRYAPGQVVVVLGVQSRDPRVVLLGRPEAALGFALLVVVVDPLDFEDGELPAGLVREGDAVARGRGGNSEADGECPRQPSGKAHLVHDALVVVVAHESRERRERSARKHVEVGDLTGGERHGLERVEVFRSLAGRVDELAAVRADQLQIGRRAHARRPPPWEGTHAPASKNRGSKHADV